MRFHEVPRTHWTVRSSPVWHSISSGLRPKYQSCHAVVSPAWIARIMRPLDFEKKNVARVWYTRFAWGRFGLETKRLEVVFTNDASMFQMCQMRSIKVWRFQQKFHCKQSVKFCFGCIELLAAPRQAHKVSVMHRERLGPAGLKPLLYRSKKQVIHLTHYLPQKQI